MITLQPGWYWFGFDEQRFGAAVNMFRKLNPNYKQRVTASSLKYTLIVFEVVQEPLPWTLPNEIMQPQPAPDRGDTSIYNLQPGAFAEPGLIELIQKQTGRAWDKVTKTFDDMARSAKDAANAAGSQVGNALKLVLWGGAAILLINFFRRTAPTE